MLFDVRDMNEQQCRDAIAALRHEISVGRGTASRMLDLVTLQTRLEEIQGKRRVNWVA